MKNYDGTDVTEFDIEVEQSIQQQSEDIIVAKKSIAGHLFRRRDLKIPSLDSKRIPFIALYQVC